MFAEVIFPTISDKPYTYSIPDEMRDDVKTGIRVLAPVGNRISVGFVISVKASTDIENLKNIRDVLDSEPIFTDDLWKLTKWISEYYYSSWGITLRTCFPKESRIKTRNIVKATENLDIVKAIDLIKIKTKKRMKILQDIYLNKELPVDKLSKMSGVKNINSILNDFQRLGLVSIYSKLEGAKIKYEKIIFLVDDFKNSLFASKELDLLEKKYPKQWDLLLLLMSYAAYSDKPLIYSEIIKSKKASHSIIKALAEKKLIKISKRESVRKSISDYSEEIPLITLNEHQVNSIEEIKKSLNANEYKTFLLHGITGSGKTQVYIESIKYAIEQGKDAIVLVPEISLTPQLVHRFQRYFGDLVTIIHSKMSAGERYDSWRLIIEGKYRIVIGARSAIFAPLKNLGIIIVDEEHEPSYKQYDMQPRYNARDTAIMRAIFAKAVVVLGSATPSIESYFNSQSKRYNLLQLPERIDNAKLPDILVVDMKKERKMRRWLGSLSFVLREKIQDRLSRKEGIILLQNHRGFSTYSKCLNCGYVESCENCNVTLTYHKTKNHLRCHYCGFVKEISNTCPKCYSNELEFGGIGTQKVEEELHELFPDSKILRMDLDTTSKKGAHTNILRQFGEGKADILLGTQMVAKGLDFGRVTLVGVILADTGMHFPDFRANERTFQLLTQVSGRAGRSSLKGEVVIQTYIPEHYCFEFIKAQDYLDFYKYEINERRNLLYPPFGRIILIEFKGEVESEVNAQAGMFSNILQTYYNYQLKKVNPFLKILGPSPAIISKIKNQYRLHLIIKSDRKNDPNLSFTRTILNTTMKQFEKKRNVKKATYIIDVDPQGML